MTASPPGEVTRLLLEWSRGDRGALDALVPHVYSELRRQADRYLSRQRRGHTLQATALVHEAFLRLVDQTSVSFRDRAHFFAVASRAMRQILVDHARRRHADKRGGAATRLVLEDGIASVQPRGVDLMALDAALERLEELDPAQARLVELRFFGGLTVEETAVVLECSPATVKRSWSSARAWLYGELAGAGEGA
ncbi:MAG: sigma-70 family RNA polymerase sigma factor [Acidobacteria bacterium]|nr:sigma-70 family RNA polymerase sigma factor [Acidobacteriota bacterium]